MSSSWSGQEGEVRAPGPPPPVIPRPSRRPQHVILGRDKERGYGSEEEEDGGDTEAPPAPALLTFWHVSRNSSKVTTPSPFLSIFCKGTAGAQRGRPCHQRW